MSDNKAKRWCFTINNPNEDDIVLLLGTPSDGRQANFSEVQYFIMQEERGNEEGTLHWQGFIILKKPQRLSWMKSQINPRAHWEVARGTDQQCIDYCRKEDTYTGGMREEWGTKPERKMPKKREERLAEAAEELELLKENPTKRPEEIGAYSLLQPGFIQAFKLLTEDKLAKEFRNLTIITMVGPPNTGKSYQIFKRWPEAGRAMVGNCGLWFSNPTADTIVFEEFHGQIPLNKMLILLDGYPTQLEVKGGMRPALYTKVIITSNIPPHKWYPVEEGDEKKRAAVNALFDRIGYDWIDFKHTRKTGHYLEVGAINEFIGESVDEYIQHCRQYFEDEMNKIFFG